MAHFYALDNAARVPSSHLYSYSSQAQPFCSSFCVLSYDYVHIDEISDTWSCPECAGAIQAVGDAGFPGRVIAFFRYSLSGIGLANQVIDPQLALHSFLHSDVAVGTASKTRRYFRATHLPLFEGPRDRPGHERLSSQDLLRDAPLLVVSMQQLLLHEHGFGLSQQARHLGPGHQRRLRKLQPRLCTYVAPPLRWQ